MARHRLFAGFACVTMCVTAWSPAAPPPAETLPASIEQRFSAMEAEIADLRRQLGQEWLTQQRANQIRDLVGDVLADADTRASLLDSPVAAAGWSNGFFIASADGNNRLTIGGNIQFRYIYNRQDDSPTDDHRSGFEHTRTQIYFTGHVVNPAITYRVQGNFNRDGGTMFLEDAFIGYSFGNGWTAFAGQFRMPFLREFLVVEPRQQAVERSLVHQEFTGARTQGAALDYKGDVFHMTVSVTDGLASTGGFNRPALMRDSEFALSARGETLLAGKWDQFIDFAAWPEQEFGLLIGAAAHYQKGEFGSEDGPDDDELEVFQWTVDASLKSGRFNLFTYLVGRHLDDDAMISADQYGFVIQGGYFLNQEWEVFARYEWGDDDTSASNLSVVTVGFTRYFAGTSSHRLKWTSDVGYGFNEVSETWGDGLLGSGGGIAGWRTDTLDRDGQLVIRSQIQLLF